MQLEADVDTLRVAIVEDRLPASGELVERGLDQPGGPRRERVQERPGERAGEAHHRIEAEVAARLRPGLDLPHRPFGPGARTAPNRRGGEPIHDGVVGRVHGDEVALEVGRQLGDDEAVSGEHPCDLVAVGLARGRLVEIEEPRVPGRDLDALVAERRGPAREARERIERWRVRGELGEKDRRAFDRLHGMVTLGRSLRGLQRGACP